MDFKIYGRKRLCLTLGITSYLLGGTDRTQKPHVVCSWKCVPKAIKYKWLTLKLASVSLLLAEGFKITSTALLQTQSHRKTQQL
jgi:hypothetical protein